MHIKNFTFKNHLALTATIRHAIGYSHVMLVKIFTVHQIQTEEGVFVRLVLTGFGLHIRKHVSIALPDGRFIPVVAIFLLQPQTLGMELTYIANLKVDI
jgi:hypothetical protein